MSWPDRLLTFRYVVLDRSPVLRHVRVSRFQLFMSMLVLYPLVIVAACWHDGTLSMAAPAKGLAQHFGFWAIFVTTPAILWLSGYLLRTFVFSVERVDTYCSAAAVKSRAAVAELVKKHALSLSLQTDAAWILALLVFVMVGWCILNVERTIVPEITYGHDVFDGYSHRWGFYTTKLYVFLVFGVVYSIALFVAVHVTISLVALLRVLSRTDSLIVDLFHQDNCGGTSRFGYINLIILAIYFQFFVVIFAMYLTHRTTYLVMLASLFACSVLAFAQSILAVYHIQRVISRKKREFLEKVSARLNEVVVASMTVNGRFPNDLLALRTHVLGISSFPYAKGAASAVSIIRLAPLAAGAVSKILPLMRHGL